MTAIEVAQLVKEHGCQVFRPTKDQPGQYDAKPFYSGNKRGWVALDSFSASAILVVYNALNETNRASYTAIPLIGMAKLAFKLLNSKQAR